MIDKKQAQQIIRDTFESPFDKVRFAAFIKNLLNRIDDAPFTYQGIYIPDAYKQYIKTLERIGKFSDGENRIDILVITLQKETSLERARTMQRNFIAWYLNGSRGGDLKDAALAAFVSPGEEDWRFSLVKMDYKFEKTKTGTMKVKEEFTPARRWSFLVGENEKSHTAQSRLVNILAEDEKAPTLQEIENAFDIETVTKEFFREYRGLFLHTKEELDRVVKKDPKVEADFDDKGVDTVNFAKKLLGQIIFLYFLQKKGWFGVGRDDDWGTGSKHFLRELFEKKHADYNNFFNDILEPLFYEALRIDRSHDDGYYNQFNCKIPFLNGGLFDPIGNYDWVHTDILLPDNLFSNTKKTKEGDIGDGILDIFDRYNFTVKEDEPLEKEVAIDPELLGKSYEKFNAIRPDNYAEFKKALKSGKKGEENKFNKKFGVYYTPREIVHYMCQQSLINYLATELIDCHSRESGNPVVSKEEVGILIHTGEQVSENEARVLSKGKETKTYSHQLPESIRKNAKLIDDKLAEITVCDPAVGSGAFPVGMMNEIVRARNVLSTFMQNNTRTPYEFKRRCIEHSLYGVDIDPGAVEIAKLRLWLSLVVDEDDIKNIKPLPNLDYRIMQGNSLISEFLGISFDEDEHKNLKRNIEDLDIEIKGLEKESSDKQSEFTRYYNKTRKQDQNLLNEINELADIINNLKKKRTRLIKKLNNPQDDDSEITNIINEFQKKKNNFLNESNVSRKSKLKEEVDDLLVKIFETKLRSQKADYFNRLKNIENKYSVLRNKNQRDELIKEDKEKLYKESSFDLESAEKQLKEFTSGKKIKPFFLWNLYFSEAFHDKGGFDVAIANPPWVVLRHKQIGKDKVEYFKRKYAGATGFKMNLFPLFVELSLDLIKINGVMSLIIPNRLLDTPSYKGIRERFVNKWKIIDIENLPAGGFDNVVAGNIVLIIQKTQNDLNDITVTNFYTKKLLKISIQDILRNPNLTININLNPKSLPIIQKVHSKNNIKLKDICDIHVGMMIKDKNREFSDLPQYKYKIVTGKQLAKYTIFERKYFDLTKVEIFGGTKKPEKHIESPKLLVRKTGSIILCSLDDRGTFAEQSVYLVLLRNAKFDIRLLNAFLNSKLTTFYFQNELITNPEAYPYLQHYDLENIPVLNSDMETQLPFIDLVDKILNITKDDDYLQNSQKQAKVKALEKEIDQLVYKLYDLTPEEIKIVEGKDEDAV